MFSTLVPSLAVAVMAAATLVSVPAETGDANTAGKALDPVPYPLSTCTGSSPRGGAKLKAQWMNHPYSQWGRGVKVTANTQLYLPRGPWPRLGFGVQQGRRELLFTPSRKAEVLLAVPRTKKGVKSIVRAYWKSPRVPVSSAVVVQCTLDTWN